MTIKSIQRIGDFRLFKSWTQPIGIEFEDINIVYGTNGSGKSTLATLLSLAAREEAGSSGLRLKIEDGSGDVTINADDGSPHWSRLLVFNQQFVENNLRFEDVTGSSANPLLQLGEKEIDDERKLERAKQELASLQQEHSDESKKATEFKGALDRLLVKSAKHVKEALRSQSLRGWANYNKTNATEDLLRLMGEGEAPEAVNDGDRALVVADTPPEIALDTLSEYSVEPLIRGIAEMLQEQVSASPIADIAEDSSRHVWVRTGVDLHEQRDECLYCTGAITDARREALGKHFDDSVARLERKIADALREVEHIKEQAASAEQKVRSVTGISPALASQWQGVVTELSNQHSSFDAVCGQIEALLRERRDSPFDPIVPDIGSTTTLRLTEAVRLVNEHNDAVMRHSDAQQEAARRIADNHLWSERDEFLQLQDTTNASVKKAEQLRERIKEVEAHISQLSVSATDPRPLAAALTQGFVGLFGRSDLVFEVEGGRQYRILRDGTPATHLSEGERNGIALLYFLCSLKAHDVDLEGSVVVIDDPVSSMDAHIAAGVSSHLWANLIGFDDGIKCKQLFLLTHDFELFRAWIHRLNRHPSDNRGHRGAVFELRLSMGADGKTIQPQLYQWDDKERMTRSRSEYHYLFWRIATTLEACKSTSDEAAELDAMFVLPNTCRRLLEAFLGFRYPAQVGNFTSQVQEAAKASSKPEIGDRITQYLHHGSHNEEPDTQRASRRHEAVAMLTSVMEFMRSVDENHFRGMCKSVKLDPAKLLQGAKAS